MHEEVTTKKIPVPPPQSIECWNKTHTIIIVHQFRQYASAIRNSLSYKGHSNYTHSGITLDKAVIAVKKLSSWAMGQASHWYTCQWNPSAKRCLQYDTTVVIMSVSDPNHGPHMAEHMNRFHLTASMHETCTCTASHTFDCLQHDSLRQTTVPQSRQILISRGTEWHWLHCFRW